MTLCNGSSKSYAKRDIVLHFNVNVCKTRLTISEKMVELRSERKHNCTRGDGVPIALKGQHSHFKEIKMARYSTLCN